MTFIEQMDINTFLNQLLTFSLVHTRIWSLGKGIKTISFFARKSLNDKKVYFGWPSQKKPKFIWTNEVTKKSLTD